MKLMRQYYPIMNTPVSASVTLLTDPPIKAKLREDIVQGDPDSVYRDDVPVFHGLSVSGDVTGQVVYAGYGRKRDLEALSAKGKLVYSQRNVADVQVSI
jgi:N-acetylated-alpha-linked acidic dipeptidase